MRWRDRYRGPAMRVFALTLCFAASSTSAARAQSLNQRGVLRLNQDLQSLWTHDGVPMLYAAAMGELNKLVGVPHPIINSQTTATIIGINSLTLDCPVAP